jgi:hypothetical protein
MSGIPPLSLSIGSLNLYFLSVLKINYNWFKAYKLWDALAIQKEA